MQWRWHSNIWSLGVIVQRSIGDVELGSPMVASIPGTVVLGTGFVLRRPVIATLADWMGGPLLGQRDEIGWAAEAVLP